MNIERLLISDIDSLRDKSSFGLLLAAESKSRLEGQKQFILPVKNLMIRVFSLTIWSLKDFNNW